MIFGRHRDEIDRIRNRIRPSTTPASSGLDEAIARLSMAVDRFRRSVDEEREEVDRLRGAFDRIPQGVVLADPSGAIVYRNRAAARFEEARHGEALVAAAIDELLLRAVSGDDGRRTIDLFGPPRRAIQLRAGPLRGDDDETITGAFVLVEDVTERQRLESIRRDFLANISHELKTPIGALSLLAETIADETDPATIGRLVQRMRHEAVRMDRLVDDLLELSSIEVDRLPDPEPIEIAGVVAEAVDRVGPAAESRGVSIDAARTDGPIVPGHRSQLVSAVANLLDNAVKYSEPEGTVAVEVTADGGDVVIAVHDEGIGIPRRDIERIFERFYRVDRARSRETGGTGLGLAIVRHVVQNHHGEIEVSSREGRGSTFRMILPAAVGAEAVPE